MSVYKDHAAKINASHNGIRSLNEAQATLALDNARRLHGIYELLQGQQPMNEGKDPASDAIASRPSFTKVLEDKTYALTDIAEVLDALEQLIGRPNGDGLSMGSMGSGVQKGGAY